MDAGDRDDIADALQHGGSAAAVASRLIVPLNDVLEVQQRLAYAAAPPRRDLSVATQRYSTPKPIFFETEASETFAMTTPPPSPVLDVFARAEQIDDRRVTAALRAAVAARDILTELVDGYAAQSGVRARIAELEEQLAAERAKLQPPAKKPAAVRSVSPAVVVSVSAKEIRAWADSAGVPVPAKGPVPKTVSEQYFAAQQVAV